MISSTETAKYVMRKFINIVEQALSESTMTKERAEKAKAAGFDVSRVLYHGTPAGGFAEFDPNRTPDRSLAYGKGIYLTDKASVASGYTRSGASWGNGIDDEDEASPTVIPCVIRVSRVFDLAERYSFAEMTRILSHAFPDHYQGIVIWREAAEEAGIAVQNDDDDDYSDEDDEDNDHSRLLYWEYADEHEDVDPDDYEQGIDDPEYQSDLADAIKGEIAYYERRIAYEGKRHLEQMADLKKSVENGRTAATMGRDIYVALVENNDEYYDYQQERKLFGGDTDGMLFRTQANMWLKEMGYDAITHLDRYDPSGAGQDHNAVIVFDPKNVRSIYAKFEDLESADYMG